MVDSTSEVSEAEEAAEEARLERAIDQRKAEVTPKTMRRVLGACFVGNFVEWFDYGSYGFLAVIIADVFFASEDPTVRLLQAFAVFALGFLIRPLGALFWGPLGDKIGRKKVLSLSIIIMTGATVAMALLPGYQTIGVLAPILLLVARLVQSFSASGEYAGAACFIAEYAPSKRRGIFVSLVPASTAVGLLFASLFVAVLTTTLSAEAMQSWGWRIPFLLAAPLGLIGMYIRLKLEDSPEFLEAEEQLDTEAAHPLRTLLAHHRKSVVIGISVTALNAVGFYLLLSYLPTYLTETLGMSSGRAFAINVVTLFVYVGSIFFMAQVSDKIGRKTVLIAACLIFLLMTVPLFSALDSAIAFIPFFVAVNLGIMLTINDGTLPAFLTEIFPVEVRFTGFAFTFNVSNAVFGGTAPFVATFLIGATGSALAPAIYLMFAATLALVAMLFVPNVVTRLQRGARNVASLRRGA